MSLLLAESSISFGHMDVSAPSIAASMYSDMEATLGFWEASMSLVASGIQYGLIDELEDEYVVLTPIPYQITRHDNGDYVAAFNEANIAINGVDPQDAYQSLVAEILDTYDTLSSEPRLGPDANAQLELLRTYLVRA